MGVGGVGDSLRNGVGMFLFVYYYMFLFPGKYIFQSYKGCIGLPKQLNFRKSSKGGGVISNPKTILQKSAIPHPTTLQNMRFDRETNVGLSL